MIDSEHKVIKVGPNDVWTHINGSIRYDGMRLKEDKEHNFFIITADGSTTRFGKIMAQESKLSDPHDIYKVVNSPMGSEGGLLCKIWENPKQEKLAAFNVSVFGDLRKFDNAEEIRKWFEKVTIGYRIRSAVLEIDIEKSGKKEILIYDFNNGKPKIVVIDITVLKDEE